MAKRTAGLGWPRVITVGNVTVRVYRQTAPRAKSGWEYVVAWKGVNGRQRQTVADEREALSEAKLKAEQLHAGRIEGAEMGRADRDELVAARRIIEPLGVPLVSALEEWARARSTVGPDLIAACERWSERNGATDRKTTVAQAITAFLKAKRADHVNTKAGYERTLAPRRGEAVKTSFAARFGDRPIASLTPGEIADWLPKAYANPSSRNSHRKRIVALFRWCRKRGILPTDIMTAAERTDAARVPHTHIGMVTPAELRQAYDLILAKAEGYVPALTLAALCGLRRSEVHGQRWEDIDLERKLLRVSAAKPNTPARRLVPIHDSAVAWLRPHAQESGPICTNLAIDRLRDICRTAGLDLADNGFRHTWISARVALTGNIPETSLEAGNTPQIVNRHYRELMRKDEAEAWFAVSP